MDEEAPAGPGAGIRIAILVAAALLAYLAIRSAVQFNFQYTAPDLARTFWPADGVSLSNEARARVGAAQGEIDAPARSLYQAALDREPMLADPLTLAALDAVAQGDDERAERLMSAARARDPRTPVARLWLFERYLRTGRFDQALGEVGPSMRLQSQAGTAVLNVLTALTETDEGRAALVRKLAAEPFWRTAFFQNAAKSANPGAMLGILQQLPRAADAADANEERRAVYLSLIRGGNGAAAYRNWQASLPTSYRGRAAGIYDGNFTGFPGAQPFNWTIATDSAAGTARMTRAGDLPQSSALTVRYFGSEPGTLAEQYAYVEPGAYRFQLAARRRSSGATGGRLTAELRCANGPIVAQIALDSIDGQLRGFSAPAQISPDCPIVWVRIIGTPGEIFSEIEAQITGLNLIAGG